MDFACDYGTQQIDISQYSLAKIRHSLEKTSFSPELIKKKTKNEILKKNINTFIFMNKNILNKV